MKRLIYLLTLALPLFFLTACDDDGSDLPDVDFIVDVSGAVYSDGQLYVVAGETLTVNSIEVVNNEKGNKALISYADYYWDYVRIAQSVVPPFGVEIMINPDTRVGKHVLEIYAPVFANDKAPAFSVLSYTVNVVAAPEDLPSDGVTSFTAAPAIKESDPSK